MKKTLLIISLIVIAIVAYFVLRPDGNKIPIVIIGEDTANLQSLIELEERYESLNPNIDIVFKPSSLTELSDKAIEDLEGKRSDYDIILQYGHALATYVENDHIFNVGEVTKAYGISDAALDFEEDLFQDVWKSIAWYYKDGSKSKINKVGYPCSANTTLLVYNKDMFDNQKNKESFKANYGYELAPPSTWGAFYDISEFFTDKENNTYGVALEGNDDYIYYEWLQFLYSFGGKTIDADYPWSTNEDSEVVINSPESLDALEYFISLKPFTPSFTDVTQYKEMEYFLDGKVAMILSWDDGMYTEFADDNGIFDEGIGYAPIPGGKSPTHGGSFYINKDSEHPEEALSFILFVLEPENQVYLAKKGLSVPNRKVYEMDEIKSLPRSKALLSSIDRGGVYYDAGLDAEIIQGAIATYVQQAWKEELSPSEALQKMEEEIKDRRSQIFE